MKLYNKARFWTGIAMMFVPILGAGIVLLALLDWSWLTERLLMVGFSITASFLWMVLAAILIWNGSIIPNPDKKKKKRRR